MWSVRCLLFLRQTGSRHTILEVCEFRFWQSRDCGGHIFSRIVAKIRPELKLIIADFVGLLGGQRNRKYNSDFREVQISFQFHSFLNNYAYSIRRLQAVQNASDRLIHRLRHFDYISDALVSLHWLRVPERIEYKIAVLVYKVLHGLAPRYLGPLTRVRNRSTRSSRSSFRRHKPSSHSTCQIVHGRHPSLLGCRT